MGLYIHSMNEGLFVLKNGKGPYVDIITPRFLFRTRSHPVATIWSPCCPATIAIDEETSFTVAKGLKTLSTGSSTAVIRQQGGNRAEMKLESW